MIAADVVIEAKRVEAGSFEDREVTLLRDQRVKRRRDRTWWCGAGRGESGDAGKSAGQAERPLAVDCHLGRSADKAQILCDFTCVSWTGRDRTLDHRI